MKQKSVKLLKLNKECISKLTKERIKGQGISDHPTCNTEHTNCGNTEYSLEQLTCECPTESHRPDCFSTYSPDTPAECGLWSLKNC